MGKEQECQVYFSVLPLSLKSWPWLFSDHFEQLPNLFKKLSAVFNYSRYSSNLNKSYSVITKNVSI
jgi:hypothetical protein